MDYRTLELDDKRFTGFGLSIFFILIGYLVLWSMFALIYFWFPKNLVYLDTYAEYNSFISTNFLFNAFWIKYHSLSYYNLIDFDFSLYGIIILAGALLLIGIFGSSIVCTDPKKAVKLNKINIAFSILTLVVMGILSILMNWKMNYRIYYRNLEILSFAIYPFMQNFLINVVLIRDKNSFNYWSGFRRKLFPTEIPTSYLNKRRTNASFFLVFCFLGMFVYLVFIFSIGFTSSYNYWFFEYFLIFYSSISMGVYLAWLIFGELIGRRVSRYNALMNEPSLEEPIFNEFIVQRTSKFTRKKLIIRELSREVYHLPTIASHVYLDQQTVLETIRIAIADRKVIGTFSPDNEYFVPPVDGKPVLTSFQPASKPKKVKPGLQAIADSQFDFGLEATKTTTTTKKSEIVSRQQIVFDRPANKSRLTALLLCIFLGDLGAHRFYAGKIGTGILWLLTGGLFQIGTIVDTILISMGKFTDRDGNPITQWDTDSPRQQIQPQQPGDYAQPNSQPSQQMQPTQPIQATQPIYSPQPSPTIQPSQIGVNRGEVLRKIVKMYDSVLIDEMAQLLYFTDRISFQQWLMSLPEELEFVIHDDKVLIPPHLKDNTLSSQQLIDKLINQLDVR